MLLIAGKIIGLQAGSLHPRHKFSHTNGGVRAKSDPHIHLPLLWPGNIEEDFVVRNLHLQHASKFSGEQLFDMSTAVRVPEESIQRLKRRAPMRPMSTPPF